ncbi:anti-sigma F factor [Haloplasma contractile]|uniref:Anti-sigma F factor protein n=1 Tax=Haloplasma contractile SSD-17B TaxID=1033810 RepID=F7Q1A4_9MOLU|nr:anti-sigma F factor [Haloplasma contractile]ERJ12821.1 Anti-sigma F factor protein [Haloplasma contractile SSD-17B]
MSRTNRAEVVFDAISENEAFARIFVAGFIMPLDPTLEEVNEIKTIVSEAVTNSIVHGYEDSFGQIKLRVEYVGNKVTVKIRDYGKGIPNTEKAKEIFFTTKPDEERSGMGLTIMEAFADGFTISSSLGKGTEIKVVKKIREKEIKSA